jgi:hypothetical protein
VTVRAATAGHGDCSLLGYDFGGFVRCWYWWVLVDGLGAVALGYLVQTRREGVPGLTEDAPGAASRGRSRAVARLAALGLGVALLALVGIVLLGRAGIPAPVEFLLTLAASLAIGAGLATRRIPDIGPVSGQTPPADD